MALTRVTSGGIAPGVEIKFDQNNSPTAPAISFDTDTDTGIYSPEANTIAISTGGVERFRINADGEIILGTEQEPTFLPVTDSSSTTSLTGKTLYVNGNDSKSDDALDNNGENIARPFKTIERALIESARRSYVQGVGQSAGEAGADQFEYFTIIVYPGQYTVDNRPGVFQGASPEWSGDYSTLITQDSLSPNDYYKFNCAEGGIIVPRGTSIVGMDLRKTVIRPKYCPDPEGTGSEAAIFRLTGGCYIWQLTIKDSEGQPYATQSSVHPNSSFSHHRLVAFKFATAADLNSYYRKVDQLDGNIPATGNSIFELYKRVEENRIVGNYTDANTVDTVASASPYVFNCSLRSVWGMSGMHANGADATGFASMVVAQFTGISLQKDARAFINNNPRTVFDNYKDNWRNYHIKASNGAFIQIVSVFAVGYADHFFCDTGGDMSITNSNSNFGNTALKTRGFQTNAYPQNSNGRITGIIPPRGIDPSLRTSTIQIDFPNVERTLFAEANSEPAEYASAGTLSTNLQSDFKILYIGGLINEDEIPELRLAEGGSFNRYLAFGTTNSYLLTKKPNETLLFNLSGTTYTDTIRTSVSSADPSYDDSNNGERLGYGFDIMGTVQSGPNAGKKFGYLYLKLNTAPTAGSATVVAASALATNGTFTAATNNFANGDEVLISTLATYPTPQDNLGQLQPNLPYYIVGKSGNNFKLARTINGPALTFASGTSDAYTFTRRATPNTSSGILGVLHTRIEVASKLTYQYYFTAGTTNVGVERVADTRTSISNSELLWRIEYTLPQGLNCKPPERRFVLQPQSGGNTNDVFYILSIDTEQDYIFGEQDGIYYLTCLLGTIKNTTETSTTPGVIYLYEGVSTLVDGVTQNINYLYPVIDEDEPDWNPSPSVSKVQILDIQSNNNTYKKNLNISVPTGADLQFTSLTRETIDKVITQFGVQYNGTTTAVNTATPYQSDTTANNHGKDIRPSDRRIDVNDINVKLHRPSIIRASAHTWEYLGYGSGNYSTSLPQFHQVVLSRQEQFISQTLDLNGGLNASTGTNSSGEFYIGNNIQDAGGFESITLNVPAVRTSSQTRLIDYSNTFNSITNSIAQVNQSLTNNVSQLQASFTSQLQGLANSFTTTSLTVQDNATISTLTVSTRLAISGVTSDLGLASTTAAGIVRLSTTAEAALGTAEDIAITPLALSSKTASSIKGLTNIRMSLSAPASGTSYLYPISTVSSSTSWYLHPYRGNEISLYDYQNNVWTIVPVPENSKQFYLTNTGLSGGSNLAADTIFDVYLYNAGSVTTPDLRVEYVAWSDYHTPPTRASVQGIVTKGTVGSIDASKRYIGVIATTAAGTTRQSLGGVYSTSVTNDTNPFIGIANFYNTFTSSQRFFFATGWTGPVTNGWDIPPGWGVNAKIRVVTADDSSLTVFLDEYSNGTGIVYAAPGFDATDAGNNTSIADTNGGNTEGVRLPVDAFYAEQQGQNLTGTSCWSRSLGAGMHRIYYLHQHRDNNNLNEHPAHGWIVTAQV
jgi:hypothetical protein